ncbi:hypothetical protein EYF80_026315 [Liparis tanakae]|uniref:Uncharacterized protein n=1 Tax=Liparis tanakae TaxID=230148 RepID=A0A4Z2HDX0_9TELE|nr:hypothetical protein EYF80_026315 [Liparis tanakae]
MLTDTRLSRFRRHHCSTSGVQVALKKARRTFDPEQARKTAASCSRKPVLPPSNSLSDSSTTSHSTLTANRRQPSLVGEMTTALKPRLAGCCSWASSGRQNAKVFPDPVGAQARSSRP